MDIENLKEVWTEMSLKIEKQKKLTNEIILKMTQDQSRRRLHKIMRIEVMGILWLVATLAYLVLNLDRLDTALSLTAGILSMLICIASIGLSIIFILKANRLDVVNNTYKQTLIDFNKLKKSYPMNRKFAYIGALSILITITPVVFKLTRNADLSEVPFHILTTYFIFCLLSIPLTIYILNYYDKKMKQVDDLLDDLTEI